MIMLYGFGTGLCFVIGVWCGAWIARENAVKEFKRVNEASLKLNTEINNRVQIQCDAMVRIADLIESYISKPNDSNEVQS